MISKWNTLFGSPPLRGPCLPLTFHHCHSDYARREHKHPQWFLYSFRKCRKLFILQLNRFTNNLGSVDSGNPNSFYFTLNSRHAPPNDSGLDLRTQNMRGHLGVTCNAMPGNPTFLQTRCAFPSSGDSSLSLSITRTIDRVPCHVALPSRPT